MCKLSMLLMSQNPVEERRHHTMTGSGVDESAVSCRHGPAGHHVRRRVTRLMSRGRLASVMSFVSQSTVVAVVQDVFVVVVDAGHLLAAVCPSVP